MLGLQNRQTSREKLHNYYNIIEISEMNKGISRTDKVCNSLKFK